MENIGLLVKQARLQKQMKQLSLAKGICSVSYLSKLENSQITPSEEILSSLLQRLDLSISEVNFEEELYFLHMVKAVYKNSILERNKEIVSTDINELESKNIIFKNQIYSFDFLLMLMRLHLITERDLSRVESLMEYIEINKMKLTQHQKYVFHINKALLSFSKEEYTYAVEFIEQALKFHQTIALEKWELADLYNVAAICYLTMNYNYSAIEFAQKSLSIYRDLLIYKRTIDCHITIGISYKRNYKYPESEEHFKAAQMLIADRGLHKFEGIISQNLGTLYSVQQDSEKAISYFLQSLETQKTNEGYILTILSIVQEYSKMNDSEKVVTWSEKGIELQANDRKNNETYAFHFKIFKAKYENDEQFSVLLTKAIKFFESKRDYRHVNKYSQLLGEFYYDNKKLKKASLYYRKANNAQLLSRKLNDWEDL